MKAIVLAFAAAIGFPCAAATELREIPQAALERVVREARRDSPDTYLIAVVEVTSDGDCYVAPTLDGCVMEVKIVEFLDGRYPAGGTMRAVGRAIDDPTISHVGRRLAVVAEPVPGREEVYDLKPMVGAGSRRDIERLRDAIDAVSETAVPPPV